MKIGILTFHNIPNIGAILQAYSLCVAIRKLQVECDIIDYTCENIKKRELQCSKQGNIIKDLIIRLLIWPKNIRKIKSCQDFMISQNVYSRKHYVRDNLKELNKDFDILISGSDMIWNLDVTGNDWSFFLDFADDKIRKCSFGSSIGSEWKDEELDKVKMLLSRFDKISVRESDTCELINSLGLNCSLVVDPTMLLTADYWMGLTAKPSYNNYVIVYFPTADNLKAAKNYARKNKKEVLVMNWSRKIRGFKNITPDSPVEWLTCIRYADAVFTNSYHGMLFSIYFNVPFWIGNYGNRITSMLKVLGLEERMIKNDLDFETQIDFDRINEIIVELRRESFDYIKGIIANY
jgi:polysaccharide pyruvyl transferase WcaK-like protein